MNNAFGIYQGFVKNINDDEKRGRIQCICPEVLGEALSAWCEPCVPVAFDNGGDICIPPVDEAVWIMFINGDIDRPVWLGGWWSKDKTPFGASYPQNARVISYGGCSIVLQNGTVTINGNLKVNGDIIVSGNVSASGTVTGSNID